MVMSLARCMSAISAGDLIIAASRGHRVAADEFQRRSFLAQAVEHGEADALLDADAPLSASASFL